VVVNDGVRLREVGGRRSSQGTGRSVFASAARATDPALADRIAAEAKWRKRYIDPLRRLVETGARSPRAAVDIARAGLAGVHEHVELSRDGGAIPLREAVRSPGAPAFRAEVVPGSARGGRPELTIPYRGDILRGDSIRSRLDRWVEAGVIEPSCRDAVEKVVANPDWLDLSDRRFVILGAASEMGALSALCAWGADVAAIDLPNPGLWQRILATAREGSGRVTVPVRHTAAGELNEVAGADLMKDTPEIAEWLGGFEPPFTIIDDTYADGAEFMLVAASTDALMSHLAEKPGVSLAYLATPTDVFAVPEEIAVGARQRRSGARAPMRALSAGALYRPSYRELVDGEDGRRWGIVDCLVPQQGANYALAKTIQRWRAVASRDVGTMVSANVAPASRTRSVVKNKALAAAFRGASAFGIEIFEPETSRWLMAALLVHDLRNDGEGATAGEHPFDLFARSAAHGGIWRLPWEPRSVLPLAVLRGLLRRS
jgi:hypothetical protein